MSTSSKSWLKRHINDPFVKKSVADGYRSRAAYKLAAVDDRDRFLRPGAVVIDLGAAPGGWCQIAKARVGKSGTVIGIDLLEMGAIPGVTLIHDDITADTGLAAVKAALGECQADVVLSDMAPNMSGIALQDQARHYELGEIALDFAVNHLAPSGVFFVKVFQGDGFEDFWQQLRGAFTTVVTRKPPASRAESRELFILARDLKQ